MEAAIESISADLESLLNRPSELPTRIPKLHQQIWNATNGTNDDTRWEVLLDLAYDLEYYQPDPKVRSEDESLYGEERALSEIKNTLSKLKTGK